MLEFIIIFKWTILAGAVAATSLGLIGSQIAARDKSMQTLCVGQGAMLGVLIGIGIGAGHEKPSEFEAHFLPFIFSVAISLFIGWFGKSLDRQNRASKNTYFIALFSVILAMNYLVSAVFPSLESHMAQVFFGDLATLSEIDVWITLLISIILISTQMLWWRQTTNRSFELAIFGSSVMNSRKKLTNARIADGLAFLYVCFSIQMVGFLYTIACMFLPTIVLSFFSQKNLKTHLRVVVVVAAIGSVSGFLVSLFLGNIPTVPTIAVFLVLTGVISGGILQFGSVKKP